MMLPFWSWYLSDTIHVRSHTNFQLIWAINTAFSRGGHNVPPPSVKCEAGTPSVLGLKEGCFWDNDTDGNIDYPRLILETVNVD